MLEGGFLLIDHGWSRPPGHTLIVLVLKKASRDILGRALRWWYAVLLDLGA